MKIKTEEIKFENEKILFLGGIKNIYNASEIKKPFAYFNYVNFGRDFQFVNWLVLSSFDAFVLAMHE
jgi:hypothetical protein